MSYIQFNGYDSSDDLIITKPIVRPTWGQAITETTLPGNTRSVIQKLDCYENAEFTIDAVIKDATPDNVHRIYAALSGFGKLLISTAPHEEIDVWIKPITPEAVALLMAEIKINVIARPFAMALIPTITALSSESTIIKNTGTVFATPTIRLKATAGTAKIMVNGEEFIIEVPSELIGKEIIVDCDNQVTYYIDGNGKNSINNRTYNDYPLLHIGNNYCKYSGTVTSAEIELRERWL